LHTETTVDDEVGVISLADVEPFLGQQRGVRRMDFCPVREDDRQPVLHRSLEPVKPVFHAGPLT